MNMTTLGVLTALAVLMYLVYRCLPFFYDYRFSSKGIDVVVGRVLPVFRIKRERIEMVEVRKVSNIFIDWERPFAVALGNRIVPRLLAVKTNFAPHYWYFTPADPDEAARCLGFATRVESGDLQSR